MGIKTRNFANNILSGGTIDGTDFLSGTLPSSNITNDSAASVTSIPSISNVVSSVAGDPPSAAIGDIWYNSSTNTLKFQGLTAAAWATGGNMGQARERMGSAGAIDSGVAFSGINSPTIYTNTEEYNGSTWTAGGAMSTTRFGTASATNGTQTAALGFAGRQTNTPPNTYTNSTEEYDGSTWTAGGVYPASLVGLAGAGTQTAGLGFAGSPNLTATNEYDGSTWTAGGAMNTGKSYLAGFGLQTAGLAAGGAPRGPSTAVAEEYDGSAWTNSGSMNTARNSLYGNGIQTQGLIYGGDSGPGNSNAAETYDGTGFTTAPSLATARRYIAGFGNGGGTTGVACGGFGPPTVAATEEFTGASGIAKTFTTD